MIEKEKIIGIIGGMGPMATVDLFNKIVVNTNASSDQEHIRIIIDNNTSIPDRSNAIINNGENPVLEIVNTASKLLDSGANVLIMSCNTAHYFYKDIKKRIDEKYKNEDYVFLNMIEETSKFVKLNNIKNIYLFATIGTYQSRVYQDVFTEHGINIIMPDSENQNIIMESIYNYKKGINNYHKKEFADIIDDSKKYENIKFLLGCTELPIIFKEIGLLNDVIDPTEILAKAAIKMVKK